MHNLSIFPIRAPPSQKMQDVSEMTLDSLPCGFRFHPTDVVLVTFYLKRKIMGMTLPSGTISDLDLYKYSPWDLAEKCSLQSKDLEWYFFCRLDRKYGCGSRSNRLTDIGYWKITGKGKFIFHKSRAIGIKRILVFHMGRAPRADRTNWVMHEYRLEDKELLSANFFQEQSTYVLCKIFKKSSLGPRVGEQYDAIYKAEDWENNVVNKAGISNSSSVVSLHEVLPHKLDLIDNNTFVDQTIEDPDISMHLSHHAYDKIEIPVVADDDAFLNGQLSLAQKLAGDTLLDKEQSRKATVCPSNALVYEEDTPNCYSLGPNIYLGSSDAATSFANEWESLFLDFNFKCI